MEALLEMYKKQEAFLAALRRFFARRGKSHHMYSDNGTHFLGAARRLDKEFATAIRNNSEVVKILAEDKINWHFIPPASPHFGGLWEAGVKSMKHHLKRVIRENKFTFEDMSTLLAQVEGVLNSRPLYAVTDDIESDVLTPGHFLIGHALIDIPEPEKEANLTSLNRWKLVICLKKTVLEEMERGVLNHFAQSV
ncbi:uncharacterized protein LOC142225767 [Haematobia irritans]|uniref:uncharacterized protein LOC142225767 n=1 Tax=Haematobia irritans TaxID=7368 RepID=UPI003F4F7376